MLSCMSSLDVINSLSDTSFGNAFIHSVRQPFFVVLSFLPASLVAQLVEKPPAMQETWVQSLGWEDPLEKGIATHSSILAWRIPWTIQSTRSQRVGHG